jgi:hypothetical protein
MSTKVKSNNETANGTKPVLGEVFSDKEQLADFIQRNIPIWVKPTKKSKTAFVGVFKSDNAMRIVVEALTDKLWEKLS